MINDFKFATFVCRFLCDATARMTVKGLTQCFGEKPLHKKECSRGFPYRLYKMPDSADPNRRW